jgi:16S rRNA (uracil1498-N3)-methyltransferase
MAVGDSLSVADGLGRVYSCELTRIRDERCDLKIKESYVSEAESPVSVTLYMAYPKSDKLEQIIQKAAELGAARIIPFESSRCIKRPKAEKAEKQTARLQRIAEEAAKQCGRAKIPQVLSPVSFKQMLQLATESQLALLCYENERATTIKEALKSANMPKSISVIVGSEGGFSPEEAAMAEDEGCRSVTLGSRILRCETAPDYALSAISYEYEL